VSEDGYNAKLAHEVVADLLERFLRYVRIDTQSDLDSTTTPSTAKQLELSRLLVEELLELGIEDAQLDEHGYVFATVPATVEHDVPAIGLIAHVDTSPDVTGSGVNPQVVRYEGGEIVLSGDGNRAINPERYPELADHVNHDIVTTDGTTLLGADDKAGVAEIMAAVAYLARHPEVPHGRLRIAFTPDEEVGRGTENFDIDKFGVAAAYTLDGSTAGEIQDETFSADEVFLTIRGHSSHPGSAKDKLVNSIKIAADLIGRLPESELSPETTEERQGYVHPHTIRGVAEEVLIRFIVRDFETARLADHLALIKGLAEEVAAEDPRVEIAIQVRKQYRNMKDYLGDHPHVLEAAEEAVRRAGLEPKRTFIRGGTDGAMLTERGLPTPNLFTGGHEYHSVEEWVCVQDMTAAVATIVHLAQVWAERNDGTLSE
jgi:tripeptide aminopeptidase